MKSACRIFSVREVWCQLDWAFSCVRFNVAVQAEESAASRTVPWEIAFRLSRYYCRRLPSERRQGPTRLSWGAGMVRRCTRRASSKRRVWSRCDFFDSKKHCGWDGNINRKRCSNKCQDHAFIVSRRHTWSRIGNGATSTLATRCGGHTFGSVISASCVFLKFQKIKSSMTFGRICVLRPRGVCAVELSQHFVHAARVPYSFKLETAQTCFASLGRTMLNLQLPPQYPCLDCILPQKGEVKRLSSLDFQRLAKAKAATHDFQIYIIFSQNHKKLIK